MGYLFAFLSVICFGVSNCLWVFPQKHLPFLTVICLRSGLTSVLFGLLVYLRCNWTVNHFAHAPVFAYEQAIVISLLSAFGLLLYVFSLRFTVVGIAVPVSSISAFFGILTAVFFLHEMFTTKIAVVFLIITLGVVLLDNKNSQKKFIFSNGVWLNLGAAVFWGVTFALFYIPVKKLGAVQFSFVLESTVFALSLFTTLWLHQWKAIPRFKFFVQLKWIMLLAILGMGGVLFYNLSLQFIPVVVVSLIGCLVPGISVLVSALWLGEKITFKKLTGIAILTAGIAALFYYP
jgi:drug/metabolite transporter (DMT)-like permease